MNSCEFDAKRASQNAVVDEADQRHNRSKRDQNNYSELTAGGQVKPTHDKSSFQRDQTTASDLMTHHSLYRDTTQTSYLAQKHLDFIQ